MRIKYIVLGSIFFSIQLAFGQIGVGTSTPDESSVLEVSSTDQGLLMPRMTSTQRDGIANPAKGLIIYNLTEKCLQINSGSSSSPIWSCIGDEGSVSTPTVISNCSVNGFEGTYANGIGLTTNEKFSVTLTNNSFTDETINFSISDLNLSGVSGVNVTGVNPTSASLTSGSSVTVEYTLTGTPGSTGTLVGVWSKLVLSCTRTKTVTP